ncbi:DUF1801 domain-containing protein [Ottowia sp. GY511]|uniref:Iron chaperone n=1 Tax=Ottowia flava TaxID=2675430 RepID=A0ABW4KP46_9BURK|nr:DUF1801 domain-containing protein [Ottowia sp. GY511]TXK28339.1 DUF1801 domain-containing protein [Ottowia sp. GY511]
MPALPVHSVAEYIAAAPGAAQPHLRALHHILQDVAPQAQQCIKWKVPFFVEPRFLFSFAATRAHLNFAPSAAVLADHRQALAGWPTTANFLQVRYTRAVPEALVRQLALAQLARVRARTDDAFW